MKQAINEEMKMHEEWFKEAKDMTMEKLPEFLRHLMEDYQHDYGTICHALGAGAIATAWALDRYPQGGITGFQAGFVMWDFIRNWSYSGNKTGLKIIDYDNLLYPQFGDKFEKVITADTWRNVQEQAKLRIADYEKQLEQYSQRVQEYPVKMEKFLNEVENYRKENPNQPNYKDNPGYCQELDCGTSVEWDEFKKRKESGVPMQPREPYFGGACDEVLDHWKSIVDGVMPFGFRLEEE
jgi:hypothetical protein